MRNQLNQYIYVSERYEMWNIAQKKSKTCGWDTKVCV